MCPPCPLKSSTALRDAGPLVFRSQHHEENRAFHAQRYDALEEAILEGGPGGAAGAGASLLLLPVTVTRPALSSACIH